MVLARALERPETARLWPTPRRGLRAELLRTIGELKAAFLSPEEVAEVARGLSDASARRLDSLARVYAGYETELARVRAVDRHGREWLVAEALAQSAVRPASLAGVVRVVFAEIYDFSVLQYLIATAIIRLVGDAEVVVFAHPENVDATRFLDRTWNRFVADATIADQVLPSFVVRGGRQGNLEAVLRGVFSRTRGAPVPADGSIRLVAAPNRYREVEEAVRDVRRRLDVTPAARIALVARDLAVYRDLVEDVCRRYRVPVHFRKGTPLVASTLVRSVLGLLRCVVDGFPRARLEAVLETDYLRRTDRRLARTLGIVGFVAEDARSLADCVAHERVRLARRLAEPTLDPVKRVELVRRAAELDRDEVTLIALVDELRRLDAPRTVAEHVRALRRALRRLGIRPAPPAGLPPTAAVRRDARAWARLDETLATLGGLACALGLAPMPLADFVRLLAAALAEQEIDDAAPSPASVRALSVLDARGLDFDVVWVLGLDDGTFPAPRGESPLFPDDARREAGSAVAAVLHRKLGERAAGLPLGGVLRTAREAALEDPFLFFLALSMPERELVLSWPAVNEQGNPTIVSPFVDEVRTSVAGLPVTRLDPTEVVPRPADCCEPAELVARAALDRWTRRPDVPPDRLAPALRAALPDGVARLAGIDRRARVEERRSRYFLTSPDDPAKEALADPWVGRLRRAHPDRITGVEWSPTVLNELGACGFKFFARRHLGLKEIEDPELAVAPRERGTLLHAVLEGLFRAHPRLPPDLDDALALARRFVADARAGASPQVGAKDPAFFDLTWVQVEVAVDAIVRLEVEAEAARSPDVEVERLLEEELRCVLAGGIVLKGRPDRVDVIRQGGVVTELTVIDYKASRTTGRYSSLLNPKGDLWTDGFQVPVYLLGALARVPDAEPDAALRGGYLLPLSSDQRKGVVKPMERTTLRGGDASQPLNVTGRIEELVAAVAAGRFDVAPAKCEAYCPYRGVCRYQPPPLEDEVAGG